MDLDRYSVKSLLSVSSGHILQNLLKSFSVGVSAW